MNINTITFTRNGELTTIAKGKEVYTNTLKSEQFKELMKLINNHNALSEYDYNVTYLKSYWDDIVSIINPIKKLPEGFQECEGKIYYKDLPLPVAGLLQERMIQAIEEDNTVWLESLVNFHRKCCNNKDTTNINKLYDHLAYNNKYTLTQDGYIKVYKKATIKTDKDFDKFKGFRITPNLEIVNDFREITEDEKKEFLELCDTSKVYASHINYDTFYLVNPKTLERTEHKGRCEYKLNYITMLDKERCEREAVECAFKLHSTCQADYADKFSGNIVLTCLLDPEWVVFVPDTDLSWKIGSYALWTIGIDDIQESEKQARLHIEDSYDDLDDADEEDTIEEEYESEDKCPNCGSEGEFYYSDRCHECGWSIED